MSAKIKLVLVFIFLPLTLLADAIETQIKAKHADLNYKTGINTYIGNVSIIHGPSRLTADKAITYSNQKHKLQKATAYGNPAHLWQRQTNHQVEMHAYAKQIDYYPTKQLVVLTGDGKIIQGKNTLQAPIITYNIQTQTVVSEPLGKERTTLILQTNS